MADQNLEAMSITCAGCGAQLDVPADVDTVVCSFCGDVNAISGFDQYDAEDDGYDEYNDGPAMQAGKRCVIPLGASFEDLEYQIYFLLANHVEGPSDLLDQIRITKRELMYVPTYVYDFGYTANWSAQVGTPNSAGVDWHFASGADSGNITVAQYGGSQLKNAPLNPLQLLDNTVSKGTREEFSQSRLSGYKIEEFSISTDQATEQADDSFSRAIGVDLKKRLPGKAQKDVQWEGKYTSEKVTECYVPLCYAAFSYRNQTYHLWMSGIKDGGYLVSPLPRTVARNDTILSIYIPAVLMLGTTFLFSAVMEKLDFISAGLTVLMAGMAFIGHQWRRKELPRLRKERLDQVYKFLQHRRENAQPGQAAPMFSTAPFKLPMLLAENIPPVGWVVLGIVEIFICLMFLGARH